MAKRAKPQGTPLKGAIFWGGWCWCCRTRPGLEALPDYSKITFEDMPGVALSSIFPDTEPIAVGIIGELLQCVSTRVPTPPLCLSPLCADAMFMLLLEASGRSRPACPCGVCTAVHFVRHGTEDARPLVSLPSCGATAGPVGVCSAANGGEGLRQAPPPSGSASRPSTLMRLHCHKN